MVFKSACDVSNPTQWGMLSDDFFQEMDYVNTLHA